MNANLAHELRNQPTRKKQCPLITLSKLTTPHQWFVVTRWKEKSGISMDGQNMRYLVALEKFNVTDQMEKILKSRKRS